MSAYDAIVIGSGMSGLAAANILAREGQRVLVCEQHSRFGGYLQRFVFDRTVFDAGCHYVGALGEGDLFDRYLRYLGVRDALRLVPLDPDGFDVIHACGHTLRLPVGHAACAARFASAFPAQAGPIRRFFDRLKAEVGHYPMYHLSGDTHVATRPAEVSLAEVLTQCGVTDPTLRQLLAVPNLLYFVAPEQTPFRLHAFVVDSYLRGAFHIDGGGQALVRALVKRLRASGGVAKRHARVERILTERSGGRSRVTGVQLHSGERATAPVVIAAIDPKVAASLLDPDAVRPVWRRRVSGMTDGLGGLVVYARVSGDWSRWGTANHFFGDERGTAGLFDDWAQRGAAPPVWMTVPSWRETRWRGAHAMVAITGVPAAHFSAWSHSSTGERPDAYHAEKRRLGERVLDRLATQVPELAGLETWDVGTPLTHRDYTGNSSGAPYGLEHSLGQTGARGIGWRTRVSGLLLAGHSVLFPGLIGATISAFYACGELLGLERLHARLSSDHPEPDAAS